MPEMPDVVATEPIESAWGNDIRDRTAQRYADSTERDTLNPLPVAGDIGWLDAEAELTMHNGTVWVVVIDSQGGVIDGSKLVMHTTAAGVQFTDDAEAIQFEISIFGDGTELSIWSTQKGERILRFTEDGGIALRPANNQPVKAEANALIHWVANTTGAPSGGTGMIARDASGAVGNGGFIGVAAAPSLQAFQGVKGYLTSGGGNGRGRMDFYHRAADSDTSLTRNCRITESGIWQFTSPPTTALADEAAAQFGATDVDLSDIISHLLQRIEALENP